MNKSRKVRFICPAIETGGPENINQVCAELSRLGCDSAIAYYADKSDGVPVFAETPPALSRFEKYGCRTVSTLDGDALIVMPECLPAKIAPPDAETAVFWLSVDNSPDVNACLDLKALSSQKGISRHLVQSAYARRFLKSLGIKNISMLQDYVSDEFYAPKSPNPRKPRVLYNPRKGGKFTKYVITACPGAEFVPIEKMTPDEVVRLMDESMLYIDFGEFPGKDRLPREAALRGCAVLSGTSGAAANKEDFPLPAGYKIPAVLSNLGRIRTRIMRVLSDFDAESGKFEGYRASVSGEKAVFRKQVEKTFRLLGRIPWFSSGKA